MPKEKLRIGFVGVGNIAQKVIIPAYQKQPDAEIIAVCDINEARAREVAQRIGAKYVFTDFNDLAALDAIDAVSVCTWNNSHAAATIAALQAGKHVLCEKPMAMNVAEAEAMREAAARANRILMIGLVQRYRAETVLLKELLDAGKFGEVYFGKATVLRRRGTPFGWFTDPALSGGGPVIDLGVHVIDVTRYLMGSPKPVRVSAVTYCKFGNYATKGVKHWVAADQEKRAFGVEDLAGGVIHFDNGAAMLFEVSWAANVKAVKFASQIVGTKAGASVVPLEIYTEEQGYLVDATPQIETWNAFENEVRHFLDCVKTGATPISNADEGVTIQKILDGIYASARLGREVEIV